MRPSPRSCRSPGRPAARRRCGTGPSRCPRPRSGSRRRRRTPSGSGCGFAREAATGKLRHDRLARLLDADSATRTGSVMGSPAYMAPEQAGGGAMAAGPAADVYALGAVLYECLTGRPPFRGPTPLATLDLIRTAAPVPPQRLVPRVPRDLEAVCLACLEKEPGRRYATADAPADDLDRVP
ncbi:MAG: protein kinase, partial [Gemmataceae bacterium]|nr:protein kinase [Gemmataceae bacterium]